eukprot:gene10960-biopygen12367
MCCFPRRLHQEMWGNVPNHGAGRDRSDAKGGHLASKKKVFRSVGIPLGSDMAPWWNLQKVDNFEISVEFLPAGPPRSHPPWASVWCTERPIQSQQAPGGSPNQPQRAFQAPNGANAYRLTRPP